MLRLFQLTHHPHYIHIHNYFQKTNMVYKNVAVIGAGGIGAPIAKVSAYSILDKQLTEKRDFTPVKALVSEGANVIVVARPESSSSSIKKLLQMGLQSISSELLHMFDGIFRPIISSNIKQRGTFSLNTEDLVVELGGG